MLYFVNSSNISLWAEKKTHWNGNLLLCSRYSSHKWCSSLYRTLIFIVSRLAFVRKHQFMIFIPRFGFGFGYWNATFEEKKKCLGNHDHFQSNGRNTIWMRKLSKNKLRFDIQSRSKIFCSKCNFRNFHCQLPSTSNCERVSVWLCNVYAMHVDIQYINGIRNPLLLGL